MSLTPKSQHDTAAIYAIDGDFPVARFIATTPESRTICNDPFVLGVDYTEKLETAATTALALLKESGETVGDDEEKLVVLNILRGGLNYGLRNAVHRAYGWNNHSSAFISSQRAKDDNGDWYISENRYQKVYLPKGAHILFGDVVATGVSLEHAVLRIIDIAKEQGGSISGMTFFTIGGDRSEEIMKKIDATCREAFPDYTGSRVIYFEGVFGVATTETPMRVALDGTDLLHSPALMAPEFIASSAEALSFPIERCTIYDAGSRAFHIAEYLEDVHEYWSQVLQFAQNGVTYSEYLKERFPESPQLQDAAFVETHNTTAILEEVATQQLAKK